jgi:hypothetical protein
MPNAVIKHLTANACGDCPALKTICSGRSYMGDNCIAFTKRMTKMLAAGKQGAPAEQTGNSAMAAIAAADEYCRTHPTVGDRAIVFLAGVEWRQQHQ